MNRSAIFSDCRQYRYALSREWDSGLTVTFIGLNPSTADEASDDSTIRRCIGFAQSWGYGRLQMVNLFGFRATHPQDLLGADDPVGADNDEYLFSLAQQSSLVVAAWGVMGTYRSRHWQIRQQVPGLHYLRLTRNGQPHHPLYLPKTLKPLLWT
jgi:hypothetical protein